MKLLVLIATLLQLGSTCSCFYPPDSKLFCNNPSWNAVKFRVKEITKDLPDREDIYESLTKYEVKKRELYGRPYGNDAISLPPLSSSSIPNGVWSMVEDIWMNSEREVLAVVEESWGLGDVKSGDEITLHSHNYDSMCGVAGLLSQGMEGLIWVREGTEKMDVSGCALFRFFSEEDFQDMPCQN